MPVAMAQANLGARVKTPTGDIKIELLSPAGGAIVEHLENEIFRAADAAAIEGANLVAAFRFPSIAAGLLFFRDFGRVFRLSIGVLLHDAGALPAVEWSRP